MIDKEQLDRDEAIAKAAIDHAINGSISSSEWKYLAHFRPYKTLEYIESERANQAAIRERDAEIERLRELLRSVYVEACYVASGYHCGKYDEEDDCDGCKIAKARQALGEEEE